MSKSLGNSVNPSYLIKQYGSEALRYYLLREIPSDGDGDFSFSRLQERYAADLQNGLGNLVSRVTALALQHPEIGEGSFTLENILIGSRKELQKQYHNHIDSFQLHDALGCIWKLVDESNKLVDETKLWELMKSDTKKAKDALKTLAENFYAISVLLIPFLPKSAERILDVLGLNTETIQSKENPVGTFKKLESPLFPRLNS